MTAIQFRVYGTPIPKGSMKAFVPKGWTRPILTSDNKNLKAWEALIRAEVQVVMAKTDAATKLAIYAAPIALYLVFHLPRPKNAKAHTPATKRPDCSKLIRAAEDALSGVLFRDDAQVVKVVAEKRYATTAPHVEILAEAIMPGVSVTAPPLFQQERMVLDDAD